MWFSIDFSSHVPVYKQIVEKIMVKVAQGELKKGDFLPSVRKLAEDIGVNFNTVSRAYKELSTMGIIEIQRGEGYILKTENLKDFNKQVLSEVKQIIKKALNAGVSPEEIVKVFEEVVGREIYDSKSRKSEQKLQSKKSGK
ncbi:GntR family transcriptional regulator [Petrotoga sp. 9PW.55.5.1]|uniref:GntR family transcriptional regulator n=1 Tax=Petrotoga sp. 9PW.55.5.1 TaxID=1308979 RepID=UPI000DD682B3|nr:GntR family transcriptional regulator [Petrotoga sp. 9PW.55.5.1]